MQSVDITDIMNIGNELYSVLSTCSLSRQTFSLLTEVTDIISVFDGHLEIYTDTSRNASKFTTGIP